MKKTLIIASVWALPVLALADSSVGGIINTLNNILAMLVPFLIALAVVFFLYGVLKFILSGGDEEKRAEGRHAIIYGYYFRFKHHL